MHPLSYRSAKTQVKSSPIHSKGLFAIGDIRKAEIVCIKGGSIVDAEQWHRLENELGSAEIQISDDYFIAPVTREQRESSMLYLNHSCDANIGVQGQIIFVAMRDIVTGEELTCDWAITDNLNYQIQCHCGSPQCRGTVTGKDWMLKPLQQKYKGYFASFIQQKIDKQNSVV